MAKKKLLKALAPQRNVITLDVAENRTNYWREAVKGHYNKIEEVPRGFFLPFEDIKQIVEDYGDLKIDGIKVYFTLKEAQFSQSMPTEITCLIVPSVIIKDKDNNTVYHDIIEPVKQIEDTTQKVYSIYDVSQPCPPCCDKLSPLFGV